MIAGILDSINAQNNIFRKKNNGNYNKLENVRLNLGLPLIM